MPVLNLGILAHVDAGKTSLTERLLYAAGIIDHLGSVDDGSTRTDSLALERERGITIKSAVVSFEFGDLTVDLIDTPGHPDFIAEVERVLSVLDAAVLVISAVEGVQAQTRVLMRTLQRLAIPTLIFVNKIDRSGARPRAVLDRIAERLTPEIIAMGGVVDPGTRTATARAFAPDDREFARTMVDLVTRHDDAVLAAYVARGPDLPADLVRRGLIRQVARAAVHPVFFGSALTGAGTGALIDGIRTLLPAARGRADCPVDGQVFKVDRGRAGERIAYVRMFGGTLAARDRVAFGAGDRRAEAKVTAVSVFSRGGAVPAESVGAGRIAQLRGLTAVRIGDRIGEPGRAAPTGAHRQHFPPPSLETVVDPVRASDRGRLYAALAQLAEQDPLIDVRLDGDDQQISVALYGEVQKEVIEATLEREYGVAVTFRETTTVCIERPVGVGAAAEIIGTPTNPFLATVGLRVEPSPPGAGVSVDLEVELGSMPAAFFTAVRETVPKTLRQGLFGWRVTDCRVVVTHSGYYPRQSHAHAVFDKSMSSTGRDFRHLTPLVLMAALRRAGTAVLEPIHRFTLEIPADALDAVLPVLARRQATPDATEIRGSACLLRGHIPAARLHGLRRDLPSVTRGEGLLDSAFDGYRPVRGAPPTRRRTDDNPLDREAYLLRVDRRVARRPDR